MQFRDLKKQYQVLKEEMDVAISEVLENCNDYEKNLKLIKRIISMGHKSIIEHDYLVFAIF